MIEGVKLLKRKRHLLFVNAFSEKNDMKLLYHDLFK
jgi:hypothetical protein